MIINNTNCDKDYKNELQQGQKSKISLRQNLLSRFMNVITITIFSLLKEGGRTDETWIWSSYVVRIVTSYAHFDGVF